MCTEETKLFAECNAFDIINMYFDEWKYRHENFWKRLTQFTVITFFTTTMPVTYCILGDFKLPDIPMIFFPICGAVLALLSLLFCLSENSRLMTVDNTIRELVREHFGESFCKHPISNGKMEMVFRWRIGIWIPSVITVLQMLLVGFVIWMICSNKL